MLSIHLLEVLQNSFRFQALWLEIHCRRVLSMHACVQSVYWSTLEGALSLCSVGGKVVSSTLTCLALNTLFHFDSKQVSMSSALQWDCVLCFLSALHTLFLIQSLEQNCQLDIVALFLKRKLKSRDVKTCLSYSVATMIHQNLVNLLPKSMLSTIVYSFSTF